MGYANKSSARKAVVTALAAREVEAVEDLRRLEVARLDALQAASWDDALSGDTRAVDRILRIITLRAKLLGLFASEATGAGALGMPVVSGAYGPEDLKPRC